MRAREVEEELTSGLTPEFLNLKLNDQERLATAEQQEIRALIDYNNSIAQLARAMGISLERNSIEFIAPDAPNSAPRYPSFDYEGSAPSSDSSTDTATNDAAVDVDPVSDSDSQ